MLKVLLTNKKERFKKGIAMERLNYCSVYYKKFENESKVGIK